MDNSGIKYFSKDYADHLIDSIKKYYAISIYWEGRNYLGLTIYWNHSKGYVDIFMPDYETKALDRIPHPNPKIPQYSPHFWTIPDYVKRI